MVALATTAPSAARAPTEAEKTALSVKIAKFKDAMAQKRYGDLVDEMPPNLIVVIAKTTNITPEQLRTAIREQLEGMKQASITVFELDDAKTEFKSLPKNGVYAVIPTVVKVAMGSQKLSSKGATIGVFDGGVWYLVRITDDQIAHFREAYPEFADIELPKEVTEIER